MQVAFSRSGDFFVADGYCNSRVVRYSSDGAVVREYTLPVRSRACSPARSCSPSAVLLLNLLTPTRIL